MTDISGIGLKTTTGGEVHQASSTGQVRRRRDKKPVCYRVRWECPSDWARGRACVLLAPIVRGLDWLGLHPNTVTIAGFLLQLGIGVLYGLGHLRLGGGLLLLVAPTDALDGALARAAGKQSNFGAFLDSSLDRISDAALILGIAAHFLRRGAMQDVALLAVALVASMMVSYTRARAEALGFTCKVGLLTRMERILLIGGLTLLGLFGVLTWALAVLSVVTVVQRILHVYILSRQADTTD